MEKIEGWKNELTSVPAGGVREIVKDAESAADEIDRLRVENEGLRALGGPASRLSITLLRSSVADGGVGQETNARKARS